MKTFFLLSIFTGALLVCSCSGNFQIEKCRYSNGYYVNLPGKQNDARRLTKAIPQPANGHHAVALRTTDDTKGNPPAQTFSAQKNSPVNLPETKSIRAIPVTATKKIAPKAPPVLQRVIQRIPVPATASKPVSGNEENPAPVLTISALTLGLLSIILLGLCFLVIGAELSFFLFAGAFLFGIAALILGCIGRGRTEAGTDAHNFATTGMVLGIIGISVIGLLFALLVIVLASIG